MNGKANSTSFQPGHQRSQASIEKQRATLQERGTHPTNLWTEETKAKHRLTKRLRALGNRRMQNEYWQVMTMDGYQYEHRVIMEAALGRPLLRSEQVHHINGDKLDNRIENLQVVSNGDHRRLHGMPAGMHPKAACLKQGQWSRHYPCCQGCGRTDRKHAAKGVCNPCRGKQNRGTI